ncbi:hypothetical protein [Dactylosporangium sp. CS-033363]|uniref:hypothetical protein n=1 Tax=Dactylosporangium sp. CS-033363 TaxID=3239935 RepID=UPI003D92BCF6
MRHTKLGAALAGLATAAVVATTAQPANAAALYYTESSTRCLTAGYACAWYDQYGNGTATAFYDDAWDWSAIPSPYRNINNQSSSWESHGTSTYGNVRFFNYAGGTGANKCLKKGYAQTTSDGMDNLVSANVWVSTCSGYTQFSYQIRIW